MTIEHVSRSEQPPGLLDRSDHDRPFWRGYVCSAILKLATIEEQDPESDLLFWGSIPRGRGTRSLYATITSASRQTLEGGEEPYLDHVLTLLVSVKGRGAQTVEISTSGIVGTVDGEKFAFDNSPEGIAAAEEFLGIFYTSNNL